MSTVLRAAAMTRGILPRAKKYPPDTFYPPYGRAALSNPIIAINKKDTLLGVLFIYGVDNGIRTHDLQSHNLTR